MAKREFKGLLRSEIRKAETLANKLLGADDCVVTAYGANAGHKDKDGDNVFEFVYADCEICHGYGGERADVAVTLTIPLFDRRMTTAHGRVV